MIAHSNPNKKPALVAALCLLFAPGILHARELPGGGWPDAVTLLAEARVAEKNSDWFRAAELYGQLSKQNPAKGEFRTAQLQCLRHSRFVQRRDDRIYQQHVEQTSPAEALQVLTDVLSRLQQSYVDVRAVTVDRLFRSGIDELQFGLRDPAFVRRFLRERTAKRLADFGAYLQAKLEHIPRKPGEMQALVQEMASRGA
ncbi:MAG TPA: hypothetical protein VGP68_12920, partial [Gemmataceae bacterium]|nr:hypothetical protein [Gemmataceae bacterium]